MLSSSILITFVIVLQCIFIAAPCVGDLMKLHTNLVLHLEVLHSKLLNLMLVLHNFINCIFVY